MIRVTYLGVRGFAVESMPGQDGKTEILGEGSPRMNLRLVVVAIGLVFSAMLLGTGVYQNVVDAPNYMGAPNSLEHARGFYHATNPGMFFPCPSARDATFPRAGLSVQLEASSCHAMEAGWSADFSDSNRHDHIPISLSPERHPVCRSVDATPGILRSRGDRMGNRRLCSCRLDSDRGCFGDGVDDPHRSRDSSLKTQVVLTVRVRADSSAHRACSGFAPLCLFHYPSGWPGTGGGPSHQ
jgi:hypothetical protein